MKSIEEFNYLDVNLSTRKVVGVKIWILLLWAKQHRKQRGRAANYNLQAWVTFRLGQGLLAQHKLYINKYLKK